MLTPPLDKIPRIPFELSNILDREISNLLDQALEQVILAVQEAVELPDDIQCEDPRIEALRKRIEQVNNIITKLQEIVPIVDKITSGLKTIIGVANSIKAIQFLNPVTAPVLLAQELVLAQTLTIANANQAVDELIQSIIPKINASLQNAVAKLVPVANIISQACNQESALSGTQNLQNAINDLDYSDSIPGYPGGRWILISGSGVQGEPAGLPPTPPSPFNDGDGTWFYSGGGANGGGYQNPNGISWGSEQSRIEDATIGTEFYTQTNVSTSDMKKYLDTVTRLVESQQDLLKSLQEAPAQSYNGTTPPDDSLGKSGDYYVDTNENKIYGPKTNTGWPDPVNF